VNEAANEGLSDRPVQVDFQPPRAKRGDLDLLIDYLSGPFRRRVQVLANLHSNPIAYKFEAAEILRRVNFFHLEIIGWLGLARRLHASLYANALATATTVESRRREEKQSGVRSTAPMLDALAREEVAALADAIERLEQTLRYCEKIASAAQTILRTMSEDELSGRAAGTDFEIDASWEAFAEAPLKEALDRLRPYRKAS
jgi:hypothetical protein